MPTREAVCFTVQITQVCVQVVVHSIGIAVMAEASRGMLWEDLVTTAVRKQHRCSVLSLGVCADVCAGVQELAACMSGACAPAVVPPSTG